MIHALFPSLLAIFFAFVLDAIIGDPETKYHPIRAIGWLIKKGEAALYDAPLPKQLGGILLVVGTIAAALCATVGVFFALFYFAPALGWGWTVIVIYFCLAFRSLIDAGERVRRDSHAALISPRHALTFRGSSAATPPSSRNPTSCAARSSRFRKI